MLITTIITHLTAKVLTYGFNAYLDAQIAEEIVTYIKSGKKKFATEDTEAQRRAEKLVKSIVNPSDAYLIGLAYTVYYVNGLANYLYTRILSPFLPKVQREFIDKYVDDLKGSLTTGIFFQSFEHRFSLCFTYWLQIVANSFHWIPEFVAHRKLHAATPDKKELVKAALTVQKHNRAYNELTAEILLSNQKSEDPKITLLREAAQESGNPKAFLKACANTERAAAGWDWVYTLFLRK
jgi:hypothetical protein